MYISHTKRTARTKALGVWHFIPYLGVVCECGGAVEVKRRLVGVLR